ncbi:hypothetical protein GCM10023095_20840 [Pseudaeromonas paramecii]|uniref:Uncharacterized protein n=1 Tax=Pseudaeromonas paramecii TaxID=2138166 RepID=A0ABP8QBK3_9GAMM
MRIQPYQAQLSLSMPPLLHAKHNQQGVLPLAVMIVLASWTDMPAIANLYLPLRCFLVQLCELPDLCLPVSYTGMTGRMGVTILGLWCQLSEWVGRLGHSYVR